MTVQLAVTFTTLLLEDDYLITFHEGTFYLANYFSAFHCRSTYCDGTVGIDEEDAVEGHFVAFLHICSEMVNIQPLAGFGLELLSLNFNNCVHYK